MFFTFVAIILFFVCILKIGGLLIKKFMQSGKSDSDYYNAIKKYLGIHQTELNFYLRNELESY